MTWVAAAVAIAIGVTLLIAGVRGTQSGLFQAITGHGATAAPGAGAGGGGPQPASFTQTVAAAAAGYPGAGAPVLT